MESKNRALATTTANRSRRLRSSELTFPARLIHPQQSQLARSEDDVSNRVVQMDMWAQKMGEAFGISFTTFVLNPIASPVDESGFAYATAMLRAFAQRDERVTLERRSGRWGLYFTREPALIAQERRAETVPLKDAPLDIRERFLLKSEDFFRSYLSLCEDRLGRMQDSVMGADRTLELLARIRLE